MKLELFGVIVGQPKYYIAKESAEKLDTCDDRALGGIRECAGNMNISHQISNFLALPAEI